MSAVATEDATVVMSIGEARREIRDKDKVNGQGQKVLIYIFWR